MKFATLVGAGAVDARIMFELLGPAPSAHGLAALFVVHLGLAVGAGAVVSSCARRGREARGLVVLGILVALFMPVLGGLGLFAALSLGLRERRTKPIEPWVHVRLDPRWEDLEWRPHTRARRVSAVGLGALLRDHAPALAERRFRALVRVKHLPPRVLVPFLKLSLGDPSDEVRLFAFSMLERMRDELERSVKAFRTALDAAADADALAHAHLRVAEAHWEIAYLGLADGAVFEHTLQTALEHVRSSCELALKGGSAEFLRGRVLLQLGQPEAAAAAFQRALEAGHAAGKALPYLAECAFELRDFERVRVYVRRMWHASLEHAQLRPVMEFWK